MSGIRRILLFCCFLLVNDSLCAQYWNPNWTVRLWRRIIPVDLAALYPGPCVDYDQYVSVYRDEFDGDSLDHWFWRPDMLHCHHSPSAIYTGEHNSEDQLDFTAANNGTLTIKIDDIPIYAKGVDFLPDNEMFDDGEPNLRTWPFRSGAVTSNWNMHYGRYSLRTQVPSGRWMWPAFWMYGTCGSELDVFEFQDESSDNHHDRKPSFSPHEAWEQCDGESHGSTRTVNVGQNLTTAFHTYTLTWDDFIIRFSIDGQVITTFYHYYRVTDLGFLVGIENCQSIPSLGLFRQDPIYPDVMMKVIANAGVMKEATSASFPREMRLDYFLVQERMDCQGTTVVVDTIDFLGFGGMADWGDRSLTDGFILLDPSDSIILKGIPPQAPWLNGDLTILTAASEIVFKPNFAVEASANLIAQIRPCLSFSKTDDEDGLQTQPPQVIELPVGYHLTDSAWLEKVQEIGPTLTMPRLSPNPAHENCRVDGLEVGDNVQIVDMLGRVQMNVNSSGGSTLFLDIGYLPNSTYWVRVVRDGTLITVLKIVKL